MPQSLDAPSLALAPSPTGMLLRKLFRRNEIALLVSLLLVIAFFTVASDTFFTTRNLTNVLGQSALALTAGIGVAIVFISGEVDVSIGSLVAAVAIPLITIMNATESLALGIAGALTLGLIVGVVNGYLASYLGINSLIVTLGTLFILRGGVYLYTGQTAIPTTSCWRVSSRSATDGCSASPTPR